jgi:hypothetical protein
MAGIVLEITVDDKGTPVIKRLSDETKKAFDEMKKGPEQARGPLASLQEGWIGLTAKIAAATAVIYTVGRTMNSFVKEAAEAEQIENRLKYTVEGVGYSWKNAKVAVDEFANSIMKTTRFSDEQARQALNDMFLYTQDFTKAQQGATMAMDLATRKGIDLASATRFIGMGMTGNIEVLGRMLPEFKHLNDTLGENASMSQKAAYFISEFQKKFGGAGQADINSYSGKVDQMKNAWTDLKKVIGNDFLPVLKETFDWLTKIFKSWKGDELEGLKKDLKNLEDWLAYGIKQGASGRYIEDYVNRIEKLKGKIADLTDTEEKRKALAAETKKDIFPESVLSKEKIEEDILAFHKLVAEAERLSELGKMPAWEDWATTIRGPVLRDITQLDLEFAKVVAEAERLSETGKMPSWEDWAATIRSPVLRDITQLDLEFAKIVADAERLSDLGKMPAWEDWAGGVYKVIKPLQLGETLAQNMASAWNFNIKNIISESENMADAVKNVFVGIGDAFLSAVSRMISNWLMFGNITGTPTAGAGIAGWLGSLFGGGTSATAGGWGSYYGEGGIIRGWKPVHTFQEGGTITRPTLGLIGEGGPEAVVPLKGGKIPIEGSRGTNIYNFHYLGVNDVDPLSFIELCKRNPQGFFDAMISDVRRGGVMRKIMR